MSMTVLPDLVIPNDPLSLHRTHLVEELRTDQLRNIGRREDILLDSFQ